MKILLSSLKQFINIDDIPVNKIISDLTMIGLKVDYAEYLGKNFKNVVCGKILKINKHPNAEKLTVCEVDVGSEVLTIVCGAKNMKENDIVPTAKIGAILPNGLEIKEATLRGVKSYGMMCSAKELGLSEDASGLMILEPTINPGEEFAKVIDMDDWVFDIDITAQRGDAMSVLGIARDLAALYSKEVKIPNYKLNESNDKNTLNEINIQVLDSDNCYRYIGRIIDNVKIGPSPKWLSNTLEKIGMRSINNVVDVTNYVNYMFGHPSHAFDYSKIEDKTIIVRRANQNEQIEAIDNKTYKLDENMLLICDSKKPLAIAGVIGGKDSEITNDTTKILIEVAVFNPISIRKTSKKLGISTESSQRFIRGVDFNQAEFIANTISSLICELSNDAICYNGVYDIKTKEVKSNKIECDIKTFNKFCGQSFEFSKISEILTKLGFNVSNLDNDKFIVNVPTFRHDIKMPCDIYEEFLRIYGYNNINLCDINLPYTQPIPNTYQITYKIADFLSKCGFNQCMNYSFIGKDDLEKFNYDELINENLIKLVNPLGLEYSIMRPTLIPSLLKNFQYNLNQKADCIKLFELGYTYYKNDDSFIINQQDELYIPHIKQNEKIFKINENLKLGLVAFGLVESGQWNLSNKLIDFYYVKGVIENLFNLFKINVVFKPLVKSNMHPKKTAAIYLNNNYIGYIGVLHPRLLKIFEIADNKEVIICEINIENINLDYKNSFKVKQISKFPVSTYDLAVLVDKKITYDEIKKACFKGGGKFLKDVRVFDEYIGKNIPDGKKSVAITLTFQSDESTLDDAETKKYFENIILTINKETGGVLRS